MSFEIRCLRLAASWDSTRVAFQSDREGDLGIFWQRANGTGPAERLTKPEHATAHVPESWSPKGDSFLYSVTKSSDVSLWTFSVHEKKALPFGDVRSFIPPSSVFSPDGQWVAYQSGEPGNTGVYVQPFPGTGAKYQISKGLAGVHPVWSPDGKELFYSPGPGQFVVVSVKTKPSFTFGNPLPISVGGLPGDGPTAEGNRDITPDGKQFIGVVPADQTPSGASESPQINVVLNWTEEQRVPTK